ncbi:WD repeat-containing protein WRAP73-like [Lingula anatina]|uniref:WD repeat-containing protein WRAP73-like n=1 Tax=Lingula anatina TaxID=7574 RepID=A0A1S3II40_LINAN|nr:WD repeat-containing protein WRAP73-like [Lingula anatina]|eukprot:XP_013397882.1 WD repeat-containing protein WRAP73-like [Lingula anatina]
MNFSEIFKQSNQLCKFSPDGNYLANAVQYRLIVRDVKTLQILNLYTCLDAVQYVEWSSDSQFILCGMYKRGLVQIWSLEQPEWTCKIDEGSAGLVAARWSPDSRHVLTTADFHLRITVWSLVNKSVSYIKYPKGCQKGLDFNDVNQYLALAERRECKDYVSIFTCNTWQLVKHFETSTDDLAGVSWSPDGRVLCVYENCLQYKVLLYSVDGRCLSEYSAYEHALGVKNIAWAPSSQFLAIGSYDQKVRILNHITWRAVAEFDHPSELDNPNVIVYKEWERRPQLLDGESELPRGTLFSTQSKYELVEGAVLIPTIKTDLNKANPKIGVGKLGFSANSKYLYTINDNMPHTLWIWDIQTLSLAFLLIHASPIKCVEWDPVHTRLGLATGNNSIYMWSPAGCLSVPVPTEATFQVNVLRWHLEGRAMVLIGKDEMSMCYLTDPEQQI